MSSNWLSHSVIIRSCPDPIAVVGSGVPCIHAGGSIPAISQNVGARSTCPTGSLTTVGCDAGRRRRAPDQRDAHQRVAVVRALEQQPVVALELAVVRREQDVGVVEPAAVARHSASTRPHASSISSFSTCIIALTSRTWSCVIAAGTKRVGPPSTLSEASLEHAEPVRGLLREDLDALRRRCRDARPEDRARASSRDAPLTPVDPTGDAGPGSSSRRTSRRRRRACRASAIVRSATQSVW